MRLAAFLERVCETLGLNVEVNCLGCRCYDCIVW